MSEESVDIEVSWYDDLNYDDFFFGGPLDRTFKRAFKKAKQLLLDHTCDEAQEYVLISMSRLKERCSEEEPTIKFNKCPKCGSNEVEIEQNDEGTCEQTVCTNCGHAGPTQEFKGVE